MIVMDYVKAVFVVMKLAVKNEHVLSTYDRNQPLTFAVRFASSSPTVSPR